MLVGIEDAAEGSSPRAGRRRLGTGRARGDTGLIPAGGEATRRWSRSAGSRGAHPRGRGGDPRAPAAVTAVTGSSPRAGRRLDVRRPQPRRPGLIPAGGEATVRLNTTIRGRRAHPRGRGGDVTASDSATVTAGSSPRAGRRQPVARLGEHARGLIPAGGEATRRGGRPAAEPWAHPRGRGGDPTCWHVAEPREGSSPRAGRRPRRVVRSQPEVGLIPAGGEATAPDGSGSGVTAGSSPRAGRRRVGDLVGVDVAGLIPAGGEATRHGRGNSVRWMGSSPRAGRRPGPSPSPAAARGLIPAGGEATIWRARRITADWAHPRGRGGDSVHPV